MKTSSIRLITLLVIFSAICSGLSAKNYFVASDGDDSNPGSKAKPWKTIQKAADSMVPGDQVTVKEGTYDETIKTAKDGEAGKRITFKASGLVKIKGFRVNNTYTTVDGFEVVPRNFHHSDKEQCRDIK